MAFKVPEFLIGLFLMGAAQTTPPLEDPQLEDIFNMITVITSEAEGTEKIILTPAIVSSYGRDKSKLGIHGLLDILAMVPGVQVIGNSFPTGVISIRGVFETANQKVLFLVNGVPAFGPAHSEPPLLGIPLAAIERVEVIRGGGDVVHGTNATAGVVNVITKLDEMSLVEVELGSHNSSAWNLYHGDQVGRIRFSLAYEGADGGKGWPGEYRAPSWVAEAPQKMEKHAFIGRFDTDFGLHGQVQAYYGVTRGGLGVAGSQRFDSISNTWDKGYLVHLSQEFKWGQANLELYSDFHNGRFQFRTDDWFGPGIHRSWNFRKGGDKNYRWRTGLTVNRKWNRLSLFTGVKSELRSTGSYELFREEMPISQVIMPDSSRENAVFQRLDWSDEKWRVLAGFRLTDNDKFGQKITPSAALVKTLSEHSSLKLLHSVGFNSPNFIQQNFTGSFLNGNPDLVPEKNHTTDLAYSYVIGRRLLVVNVFYMDAEDFVIREQLAPNLLRFANGKSFHRWGGELDYQAQNRNWKIFGNLAYHSKGDDDFAPLLPSWSLNGGAYYFPWNLGASLHHLSEVGDTLPSFTQVNLNWDWHPFRDFTVSLGVDNILEEQSLSLDAARFVDWVPTRDPDRTFHLRVLWRK